MRFVYPLPLCLSLVALLVSASFSSLIGASTEGTSFYTERLVDPAAVYLDAKEFGVVGDGKADDTEAIQSAINAVQAKSEYGVLYVPEGIYRVSDTIYIWKGIRLIGFGSERPTFVLPANSVGYQSEEGKYIFNFVSNRPREGQAIRPANPGTFYSGLSNVNVEIGEGNSGAIGVRSHFAQHCFLAHIDFRIGSGRAGVEKVGNEIEDCRFFGGDYGIITTKPSPSWPFVMVDSFFEGQRVAAISTEEAGLTLLRISFKDTPSAIVVNPDRAEELYLADSILENISGPAVVISDEYNARPQFNIENVVANNVPTLAAFRKSGKKVEAPSELYRVKQFTHGFQISEIGEEGSVRTTRELEPLDALPEAVASDVPRLPEQRTWANLKDFGAVGDGEVDDTEALRAAIAANRTVFLPTGRYRVSDTITLQPDTVLIGASPITTQILIKDYTPAFMGAAVMPQIDEERIRRWGLDPEDEAVRRRFTPLVPAIAGAPKPLLVAPQGGRCIVSGIGLDTGGANPSAVALKWMAGTHSMVNDVRFLGGHGTYRADGSSIPTYNENRTADGDYRRRWDSQYASLWVTNGGGGTFKNIWTPSPYAQAGMRITNTATEGRVYQVSSEHHVRAEVQLSGVENWKFYALQFEEESGEGPDALPLEIEDSRNLLFVNTYLYRVDRMISPFPYGVKVRSSEDITFCGLHVYSPTKFSYDVTLYDESRGIEVRPREIARLEIGATSARAESEGSERVEKIAGGFQFADAMTADRHGNIYFIDGRWHRIYEWNTERDELSLVLDAAISPVGIVFDSSDNAMVLTASKDVFTFDPADPVESLRIVEASVVKSRPEAVAVHPGHRWRDSHDLFAASTAAAKSHFVSPDGSLYLTGLNTLRRCFTLRKAIPGQPFYLADEFGQKVWRYAVAADGRLSDPELFAENGELDLVVDSKGNVYVAAGQVYVYSPKGELIDRIDVPERPASLAMGGKDGDVLYIAARSSVYRVALGAGD
ncbi:glycosyl hydrolase family 28-related protein [Pelagicoccus sp. SDUM812002]|uniref:glycosyl hydrolase family 28-related protein n=1 Tax=Pelagicoccus sp. SDUM812002 TaxID=3041266 RepID=UPI00280F5510|nr:glycosyl hydrolase family 28-related protein [Pelagicoccus sp. SDUM812002]MDQ8184344.1 glycosyl hydrolase family 28-related protein [Pelagicoccus sp. SDUM812002]